MRRRCAAFIFAFLAVAGRASAASASVQPSQTPLPNASPAFAPAEPSPSAVPTPSEVPTPSFPPAGVLPPTVALTITGNPADAQFVRAQVVAALDRAIRPSLQSGAAVAYGDFLVAPLDAGFEATYAVPATISAAGAFSEVSGTVEVHVTNAAIAAVEPRLLFYDDDPEYVDADGVLFRGSVQPGTAARLYYYHEDRGARRRFLVLLSSAARNAVRTAVIDAPAGPDADVMSVGHAVSRTYLIERPANEGAVLDVASGAPTALRDATFAPGQLVAGAVDLTVLGTTALTITVMAIPPDADPATYLNATPLPGDGHNRHGTFSIGGTAERIVAYTVGGPDASLEYGGISSRPPNVVAGDRGNDYGDYGVLEQIRFDVANPLATPATVFFYESPVGGVVRNSYLVDGRLVEMGCARLSQRYQISQVQVGPQSSTVVRVLTMPDGGSNYPVEVGVTTTPPQPATPPLSAPDGCFPKPNQPPVETPTPPAQPSPTQQP